MLNFFTKLSTKFIWVKPLAIVTSLLFMGLFCYAVIVEDGGENDVYIIPSIMGFIWSLLLISIISLFTNVPDIPSSDEKFFNRIKIRIKRGFYHLLSFLFVIITIAIILLTLRTFLIWQGSHL